MLTEQEKTELNYGNLSDPLRSKIDAAFNSPYLSSLLALSIQKKAFESEMIENPFTIRGSATIELTPTGMQEAMKEAVTARQNSETLVKVAKWIVDASDDIAKLQQKLTPEELKEAETILSGTGEEIKDKVRRKHGLS